MSLLAALRDRLIARVRRRSVLTLVRMACWAALLGLAIICASILRPMPLTVIFAMSVGHVIGGFAFLCYLLSILADSVRRSDPAIAPDSMDRERVDRERMDRGRMDRERIAPERKPAGPRR